MARSYTPEQIHERRYLTLGVMCLSLVLVVVSVSSLNVAIPTLGQDLQPTQPQLLWIVDAYALVFAGLLLPAGALGDRFGRKGALILGLVIFGVASLASAFVDSPNPLIVLRGVSGIGAAFIMPATLSIIVNVFPSEERAKAIGIWAGFAGAGAALGPVITGWMLDHFWWGSVFLVNLPFVALSLVVVAAVVPTSKDPSHGKLDPVGSLLSVAGLAALLFGIIEAPEQGWGSATTLCIFAASVVLLVGFVLWELRLPEPMLDPRLFRHRGLATGSIAITATFFGMFGMFFVIGPYMQYVMGYDPLGAGIRGLPAALGMIVLAPRSASIADRMGRHRAVALGLTVSAVAVLVMATFGAETPYWPLGLVLLAMGLGLGLAMPPATDAVVSSLPLSKAGVGSAINDTTREVGGALGIAVAGSVLSSGFRSSIRDSGVALPEGAGESIQRALEVAREAGDSRLAEVARLAYADAMPTTMIVSAAVTLLGVVVVLFFMPRSIDHAALDTEVDAGGPDPLDEVAVALEGVGERDRSGG